MVKAILLAAGVAFICAFVVGSFWLARLLRDAPTMETGEEEWWNPPIK